MATYMIEPERRTLHGHFSRDLPPVLTVNSGDTVRFRTLDAGWNLEPRRSLIDEEHPATFEPRDMYRVDITFRLHTDMRLTAPRAETPAGWLTFGFHEDLDEAAMIALEAMLDLMSEHYGMSRLEALGMASLVVDLRIT